MCGPNFSLLRGKLVVRGFLPMYGALLRVGIMGCVSLSALFNVGIFSVAWYVEVTQLISGLLSDGVHAWLYIQRISKRREIQEPPMSPFFFKSVANLAIIVPIL